MTALHLGAELPETLANTFALIQMPVKETSKRGARGLRRCC